MHGYRRLGGSGRPLGGCLLWAGREQGKGASSKETVAGDSTEKGSGGLLPCTPRTGSAWRLWRGCAGGIRMRGPDSGGRILLRIPGTDLFGMQRRRPGPFLRELERVEDGCPRKADPGSGKGELYCPQDPFSGWGEGRMGRAGKDACGFISSVFPVWHAGHSGACLSGQSFDGKSITY